VVRPDDRQDHHPWTGQTHRFGAVDPCAVSHPSRRHHAGTTTNLAFLETLSRHAGFAAGQVDTGLIARDLNALTVTSPPRPLDVASAALAAMGLNGAPGPLTGFSLWAPHAQTIPLRMGADDLPVTVQFINAGGVKTAGTALGATCRMRSNMAATSRCSDRRPMCFMSPIRWTAQALLP